MYFIIHTKIILLALKDWANLLSQVNKKEIFVDYC